MNGKRRALIFLHHHISPFSSFLILDVVDIKDMTVTACVANKHLIVKIFQECGDQEFVFIRRSGFYFGFM